MNHRTTTKWIGAVAAALTLAMVSPAPHADAAPSSKDGSSVITCKRDSGWDIP